MAQLEKVIKVTQAQYNILKDGGTVGPYTGIDPNFIYLVEEDDKSDYVLKGYINNGVLTLTSSATSYTETSRNDIY